MLVRLYFFTRAFRHRLRAYGDALFTGVWLGLLDREGLNAVDERLFQQRSVYQTDTHNLRGLFDWERAAIETYFRGRQQLVAIGVGGGREVLALEKMGFDVDGYECNPVLVNFAEGLLKREGSGGTVAFLERDAVPTTTKRYDGAIVGWGTYMLIQGRARRVEFMRGLRGLLDADAETPVLLSFFTRTQENSQLRWSAQIANMIRRGSEREPVELGDDLGPVYVHRFTEDELRKELAEAGFHLADFEVEQGVHHPGVAIAYPFQETGRS